jgi:PAS domain S-box-containing protein
MAREAENKHINGMSEFYEAEIRMHHKDGHWVWVLTRGKVISKVNGGKPLLMSGTHQDITERKHAEDELMKQSLILEETQEIAHIGSFEIDLINKSRYWSKETFRILALDETFAPPEMDKYLNLVHPEDAQMEYGAFQECIQTGKKMDLIYRIITQDGETRFVHELGTATFDNDGKVIKITGSLQDITKAWMAEKKLMASESRFRTVADLLPVGVYLTDRDGDCQYVNGKWLDIAGLKLEEALGNGWTSALHHEDKEKVWDGWNRMVESQGNWGLEYRFLTPGGIITWVYGLATPLKNEKNEITGYVGVNMDITERKLMQDTLQSSLAEKEVLLREVHHRVKNNLAAILGLLDMERQNTADQNSGKLLVELSNRIKAMSTVHEKLYRSENLSSIDFQDYLKSFLSHLRTSFVTGREINTKMEAAGIELSLDVAVPCGLIVNELVTNSLKYAFPKGKPGIRGQKNCEIRVSMGMTDSTYTLVVSDNGVGLPKNIDWREAKSLGLRLVRMLGEHQLGGEIELDKSRGTRFMIRFNNKVRKL